MPDNVEIARAMGYQLLVPQPTTDDERVGERPFVVVVVDYEGRARFDLPQSEYVEDFLPRATGAFVERDPDLTPDVHAVLADLGIVLTRVGGTGLPPIIRLSEAEAGLPEDQRVDLVARRVVEDVFGPALFDVDPAPVVICVDNFGDAGGARRTGRVRTGAGDLRLEMGFFAQHSSLQTRAHELLHVFGAVDVYGHDGQRNGRHSLMAATAGAGDRSTMLPDPWHRMALGATRPDIWEVAGYLDEGLPFTVPLTGAGGGDRAPAVVLWHQDRGTREYLVVELRDATARRNGYRLDSATASGFVIWGVELGPDRFPTVRMSTVVPTGQDRSVLTLGAEGLELGGWDPWVPAPGRTTVSTPELRWLDGIGTGFSLDLRLDRPDDFSSGSLTLQPWVSVLPAPREPLDEPVVHEELPPVP